MSFETAFKKTLNFEGGLSLDPDDSGNWTGGRKGVGELKGTKYGISAAQYPDEDIQNLTIDRAKALYRKDYWDAIHLDRIHNEGLREKLFDTAVNMGVKTAAQLLQMAINALQPDTPIEIDGKIGVITLGAANRWCAAYPACFFAAFNGFRMLRYFDIYTDDPSKRKYRFSWLSRI